MTERADISVVVATRDRPELLRDLCDSLSQCEPAPVELVIVDDGSRESVTDLGKTIERRCDVRIIRNDRSAGPAAARNRGVHASRADMIAFTDDDCVVDPDWIGALGAALGPADSSIGGVGGTVLARDSDLFSRYMEFHRVLEPRPHDGSRPSGIPYLVTANCAVRREAFMRAGGFDEAIPFAGGEDAALSMRMAKAGFRFQKAAAAVVRHRFRPGFKQMARMFYLYGMGGRYVVDRYLPV